jgi:flagellar biogenesis protein FliO
LLVFTLVAWSYATVLFAAPGPSAPASPAKGPNASEVRQANGPTASANGRIRTSPTTANTSSDRNATAKAGDSQARQRMVDLAREYASRSGNGSSERSRPNEPASNHQRQSNSDADHQGPDQPLVTDGDQPRAGQALNDQFPQRQQTLGGNTQPSAQTQPAGDITPTMGWMLQTLAALGVVIGLIFLGRWAYLKMSGQQTAQVAGSKAVEVLARTAVAPKNHVLLLRVGQRILIVGDSSQGLQTLAQVDDPEEVADLLTAVSSQQPHSATNNFKQMMGRVSGYFDQRQQATDIGRDESEHLVDRSREELASLVSRVRAMQDRGVSR